MRLTEREHTFINEWYSYACGMARAISARYGRRRDDDALLCTAHDGLISAARAADPFWTPEQTEKFIFACVRNAVLTYIRGDSRYRAHIDDITSPADIPAPPCVHNYPDLDAILANIRNDSARDVATRLYAGDRTMRQVAEDTGLGLTTIDRRKRRADADILRQLADAIG